MELCHNHNILDHLHMIRLLEDDSDKQELQRALFMLCTKTHKRYRLDWKKVWDHAKTKWKQCDIVVIEISSHKSRRPDLGEVDLRDTEPLMRELEKTAKGKKVLWVNHFRPRIIWPEDEIARNQGYYQAREAIRKVVSTAEHNLDPSPYLAENPDEYLYDQNHYGPKGIKYLAEKFYEKFQSLR